MEILPAIDLIKGQSVRLVQGDYEKETLIAKSPLEQAQTFEQAGMQNLHLVDLDGAKSGRPENLATIEPIVRQTKLTVEVGGGIRNLKTVKTYLDLGVKRVILGSSVLSDPDFARAALKTYGPSRVAIGLDCRNGLVAGAGWLATSSQPAAKVLAAMQQAGATRFIVTDIAKDGMLTGPNIELLANLQRQFPEVLIVASGGMHTPGDLDALKKAGIRSAIIGKALASGGITLAQLKERQAPIC